jgi:hypothetical protein
MATRRSYINRHLLSPSAKKGDMSPPRSILAGLSAVAKLVLATFRSAPACTVDGISDAETLALQKKKVEVADRPTLCGYTVT